MVRKWLTENKLTVNEQLGDAIANFDPKLAREVYKICGSPKEIQMGILAGDFNPGMFNKNPDELL